MVYDDSEVLSQAVKYLSDNFYDPQVNNNKSICGNKYELVLISEEYHSLSMKQSVFKNIKFEDTTILFPSAPFGIKHNI